MSTTTEPSMPPREYEFTTEQDRVVSQLSDSLRWTSAPMIVLGVLSIFNLIMYLFLIIRNWNAAGDFQHFSLLLFLLASAFLYLSLGVWTGNASVQFQQIADTRGRDIDHLMSGLDGLNKTFGLIATFVKVMVFLTLFVLVLNLFGVFRGKELPHVTLPGPAATAKP